MEQMLMRIASRYTNKELDLFKSITNQPLDCMDLDSMNDFSAPLALIRRYLRLHKDNPKQFPSPFDFSRLTGLLEEIDTKWKKSKQKQLPKINQTIVNNSEQDSDECPEIKISDQPPPKLETLTMDLSYINKLPCLTGGLKSKYNSVLGVPLLPDTGSSVSVASFSILEKLGYSISDLNTEEIFEISTVTGIGKSLGNISLPVFLKSSKGQFYEIYINFVVIKYDLTKVLLGYRDLCELGASWKFSNPQYLTLTVYNLHKNRVRRNFPTMKPEDPFPVTSELSNHFVQFSTDTFHNLSQNVLSCKEMNLETGIGPEVCEYQIFSSLNNDENKLWPTSSAFIFHTFKKSDNYKQKKVGVIKPDGNNVKQLSDEEEFLIEQTVRANQEQAKDFHLMESEVLDKVGFPTEEQLGLSKNKNQSNFIIPDCSKLPPRERVRFEQLFMDYKDIFATTQFDIDCIFLPPVKIAYDKSIPIFERPRIYSENELLLIDDYISNMLKAGIIEHGSSETLFNSNLLLVTTSDMDGKKAVSNLAQTLTREERLEALKKCARPVLDARKINQMVGNTFGTLALPQPDQLFCSMRNSLVSKSDAKSGFYQVVLHPDSREIFSFKVRNETFRFVKLPQGFSRSPNLFTDVMHQIFSPQSYTKFLEKHPQMKPYTLTDILFIYIDDVMLRTDISSYNLHYLAWKYVLQQAKAFNLKLHPNKTSVAMKHTNVLGFNVNSQSNYVSLTDERTQYFRNLAVPRTRQAIVSVLAQFSYFRNLIPCLKQLTIFLQLAARSKDTVVLSSIHKKEFLFVRWLLISQLRLSIVSYDHSQLYSTDSSHTSLSALGFQWIPENMKDPLHDTYSSELRRFSPSEGGELKPQSKSKASLTENYYLRMFACVSQQIPPSAYMNNIAAKELAAVIMVLDKFQIFLRSARKKSILFTDAKFLSYLVRLKSTSTKLSHYAILLSSYDSLFICHSRGKYFTFLSDYLSRTQFGHRILGDYGIARKFLDTPCRLNLKNNTIIDPKCIQDLLSRDLPGKYTKLAYRRQVPYDEIPNPDQIDQLLSYRSPEESLFRQIWNLPADRKDKIFLKENLKLMSKTDIKEIGKTHNFDTIRTMINAIEIGSLCEYKNIKPRFCVFIQRIFDFYEKSKDKSAFDPNLISLCTEFMNQQDLKN